MQPGQACGAIIKQQSASPNRHLSTCDCAKGKTKGKEGRLGAVAVWRLGDSAA